MYSVSGAQAKTHRVIVGAGATSLQTQEIFVKIVKDTIVQDDDSILVSNMKTAIINTNVVLNMTISPGVILIPSEMLILKEPIPGYNNVLTLATKEMRFLENKGLNYNPVQSDVDVRKDNEENEESNDVSEDDDDNKPTIPRKL